MKKYDETIEHLSSLLDTTPWSKIQTYFIVIGYIYNRSEAEVKSDLIKVFRAKEIKRQQDQAPDTIGVFRL